MTMPVFFSQTTADILIRMCKHSKFKFLTDFNSFSLVRVKILNLDHAIFSLPSKQICHAKPQKHVISTSLPLFQKHITSWIIWKTENGKYFHTGSII